MANRKVVINYHSSATTAPSSDSVYLGELIVSHEDKQKAKIYTKVNNGDIASFIAEDEVNSRISGYTDGKYNELAGIVQNLADLTITDIKAESPISASTKALVAESCGNTVTIMHVLGSEQSGFKKLSSDAYGHITGGTDVEIGDVSGLPGFQEAVRTNETKLSSGTTGEGNIVKGISVSDHTITAQMGSITSGDVTDFANAVKTNETKLTSGTTGEGNAVTDIQVNDHEITFVKGEKFALSGHTHDASEIVSGVFDIARIPTGAVSSSASGTVATGEQIQAAIDNALTSSMNYKGATTELPTANVKKGDVYIASADITIPAASSATGSAATAETGDYIIARTGGASATWDVIEKNLDGAVTSTGLTNGQIVVADGDGTEIKSVDPSTLVVGSAHTADSATTAESAVTAESADTVDLSGVQNADDLKAIEALVGTKGVLKKTAANTWELVYVVDTVSDFSGLTASGSLVDAKVVKDVIVQNERVTSAALNDLNDRINELSGGSASDITELSGSVITLSASTVAIESGLNELSGAVESLTFTQYASAITINGTQHDVVNNGVDLGDYLSASTKVRINNTDVSLNEGKFDLGSFLSASTAHITTIQQAETASAVTTTINYVTDAGTASAATITQDLIIDCGTY